FDHFTTNCDLTLTLEELIGRLRQLTRYDNRLGDHGNPTRGGGGDRGGMSIGGLSMGERGRGVAHAMPPIDLSTVFLVTELAAEEEDGSSIFVISNEIRMWRSFLLREFDCRSKMLSKIARNS
ncbi:hypothetical protein PFISCL1PPCAC_10850, partial [Pristionchus fissidentatus]